MSYGVAMFALGIVTGILLVAVAYLIRHGLPSGTATVYNVTAFPEDQKATD